MSSITYQVTVYDYRTVWEFDGKYHREDGPAFEYTSGDKLWYRNGKRHRETGPAIERADGSKSWYLNGVKMTEEEHRIHTQPATEMTIAEIEQLLGKRIKVVK
jgi:hypothetical protein